jgi:hypothetical protein
MKSGRSEWMRDFFFFDPLFLTFLPILTRFGRIDRYKASNVKRRQVDAFG